MNYLKSMIACVLTAYSVSALYSQTSPKGAQRNEVSLPLYFVEPHPEDVSIAHNTYDILDEIRQRALTLFAQRIVPQVPQQGDFLVSYPDSFWLHNTGSFTWSGSALWKQFGANQSFEFEERLVVSTGDYRMVILQISWSEIGIVCAKHDEHDRAMMSLVLYEHGNRTLTRGVLPAISVVEYFRNAFEYSIIPLE